MFAYCNIPSSSCNYRRIVKTTRRCIKNSMLMISVIFKILLNSIVCFLHISSSYFWVWGIIKVAVFSRFYGKYNGNIRILVLFEDVITVSAWMQPHGGKNVIPKENRLESLINCVIARIMVIEVPIIEDLLLLGSYLDWSHLV